MAENAGARPDQKRLLEERMDAWRDWKEYMDNKGANLSTNKLSGSKFNLKNFKVESKPNFPKLMSKKPLTLKSMSRLSGIRGPKSSRSKIHSFIINTTIKSAAAAAKHSGKQISPNIKIPPKASISTVKLTKKTLKPKLPPPLHSLNVAPAQALLLSLEHAASGTDLTAANTVIFLHPMVAESSEKRVKYEKQAIGRVLRYGQRKGEVHVIRLVVQGTVEEELAEKARGGSVEEELADKAQGLTLGGTGDSGEAEVELVDNEIEQFEERVTSKLKGGDSEKFNSTKLKLDKIIINEEEGGDNNLRNSRVSKFNNSFNLPLDDEEDDLLAEDNPKPLKRKKQ